jgi:hypothetical protein
MRARGRRRGRPFQPGQSGNPSGRPKRDRDIEALAREYTEAALRTLAEICADPKAPPAARVAAANALLDRAWGKPRQPLEHAGELEHRRYVIVSPPPCETVEEWFEQYVPKELQRQRAQEALQSPAAAAGSGSPVRLITQEPGEERCEGPGLAKAA